mmetsp:Transcript_48658/g.49432  ORF Transcript_48658/g.49432 Transcript_48658/m.49432 type:complete len:157 (+) Transcript_48658:73-543(+)
MMLLSRNTILTAVLLVSSAVVETRSEVCFDVSDTCDGADTPCTYLKSCEVLIDVGICQYRCGALGEGIPGDTNGFTGELLLDGNYTAGRVVTNAEIYKANNDTDVGDVDVGAPPPVEAKAEDKVEAQSTSGGSSAGVASYLLLAAVGAGATMIVGL